MNNRDWFWVLFLVWLKKFWMQSSMRKLNYQWKAPHEQTKTDHTNHRCNDNGTKISAQNKKRKQLRKENPISWFLWMKKERNERVEEDQWKVWNYFSNLLRVWSRYLVKFPHTWLYPRSMLIKEETIKEPWIVLITCWNLCKHPHQNHEVIWSAPKNFKAIEVRCHQSIRFKSLCKLAWK